MRNIASKYRDIAARMVGISSKKKLEGNAQALLISPMKYVKCLFSAMMLLASLSLWGQVKEDPITVANVEFKKLQQNDIPSSEGQWTRIEVDVLVIGNPDDTANNQQWVRNIEVTLNMVFIDEKAKDKKSLENMIVLKAKATLFAGKVNSKIPVVFYIPGEAYFIYRLNPKPYAWSVELAANGVPVKLNKDNYKKLLSKELTSGNVVKVLESYNKFIETSGKGNEGVLMPLPMCPFNVQWYEYGRTSGNMKIPTYIPNLK